MIDEGKIREMIAEADFGDTGLSPATVQSCLEVRSSSIKFTAAGRISAAIARISFVCFMHFQQMEPMAQELF